MSLFPLFYSRLSVSLMMACLMTSMLCHAQSVQRGMCMQYNGKASKTSLGGVEIVAANAGSTVSGAQGDFSLTFKTLKAGNKVSVMRVAKSGYVLFNKEAVDQWYISRSDKPFTIVMCKEEKYREIRNNYERISSESYARQQKSEEQKLLALRKQNKLTEEKYKEKLLKLQNDYETQLENLDAYIDRFARIDLSELTKKENAAIALWQKGKVEEAVKAYDNMNLEEQLDKEIKTIGSLTADKEKLERVAEENRQAALQTYETICRKNDMLYLAGGTENMRKIKESKRNVAFADTTFVKAMLDYVRFLNDQRDYTEMVALLDIAENNTDDFWLLIDIYSFKATAGTILDDQKMAFEYSIKTMDAVFNNKDIDSVQMAMLSNIYLVVTASVPLQFEHYQVAEELLLIAEKNTVELHQFIPEVFDLTVPCLTYEMLCYVYLHQGKLDKMAGYISKYEDAIKLQYEENTPDYVNEMSTLMALKGSALIVRGMIEEGLVQVNKAIEILKPLAEKNTLKYHERIADYYQTLAMGYVHNRQYQLAFQTIDPLLHSMEYYLNQYSGMNSRRKAYYPMMSYVFGEVSLDRGDYDKALEEFENVLSATNQADLSVSERSVRAMAKYGQARTFLAMRKGNAAILAFCEAKKYMEEFYILYPLLYGRIYNDIKTHLRQ